MFPVQYRNFQLWNSVKSFSIFGFWLINVISGKIFLGDSGSLSLGFIISIYGIFIVLSIPQISPWSIFLIIIYPAAELMITF